MGVFIVLSSVNGGTVFAQKKSEIDRRAKVEVAQVETKIMSSFEEIPGRIVITSKEAVTASINGAIEIENLVVGDEVTNGQVIAKQDSSELNLKLLKFQAQLRETNENLLDNASEITEEKQLVEVMKTKVRLLKRKAERTKKLVSQNALPVNIAETALDESLTAELKLISHESSINRKKSRRKVLLGMVELLNEEINHLKKEIAATRLVTRTAGQIIYLSRFKRGYAREGEVVAEVMSPSNFEIEAEIPLEYLKFVRSSDSLSGRLSDGSKVKMSLRVILPKEDVQTATRPVRFSLIDKLPKLMMAKDAGLILKVPISFKGPKTVVSKDAVLPAAGGHIVYLFKEGRVKRRFIRIGSSVEDGFIVKSGLIEGDSVVVRGNERLSDGNRVRLNGQK